MNVCLAVCFLCVPSQFIRSPRNFGKLLSKLLRSFLARKPCPTIGSNDIVLHRRDRDSRVYETHRSYDSVQYPNLVWQGEDADLSAPKWQSHKYTRRPIRKSVP